jgi:hypothetical protein
MDYPLFTTVTGYDAGVHGGATRGGYGGISPSNVVAHPLEVANSRIYTRVSIKRKMWVKD